MSGFKMVFVGEAFGSEEEIARRPFVGAAGQELTRMFKDAKIDRTQVYLTNVFNLRPANNEIENLCTTKAEGSKKFPLPLVPSKYLKPEYETEVERLLLEIESIQPNLIVLLGNTACWALLNDTKISKLRGTVCESRALPGRKCFATYHPAAVLRQYELRHTTILDLIKASGESEFPEIIRPVREIWLDPSLSDIEEFYKKYVLTAKKMAFDIETDYGSQITCISFAPSKDRALVVPIFDYRKPSGSYWDSLEEELLAWSWIDRILDSPCVKIAQNGCFDMQHLWQTYGIAARNAGEDTMLLHHSLHPEAPKALDFLGSVYANEVAWKTHKPRRNKTIKRQG